MACSPDMLWNSKKHPHRVRQRWKQRWLAKQKGAGEEGTWAVGTFSCSFGSHLYASTPS